MPSFQRNPINPNPVHTLLRKHPSLFGVPFILIIVGASFGLSNFTQTRYDLQDQKVKNVRVSTLRCVALFSQAVIPRYRGRRSLDWQRADGSSIFGRNTSCVTNHCVFCSTLKELCVASKRGRRRQLGEQANTTSSRSARVGSTSNRTATATVFIGTISL